MTGPIVQDPIDLRVRLRDETAGLHRDVERAVDLPGSVRTRADYAAVLVRFLGLHGPIEDALAATVWARGWSEVGVDIDRHRRAHLIVDDLSALGVTVPPEPAPRPAFRSFGEGLGCLYVLEGSSLGGRVLGPAIRRALGDVPVRFLAGDRGQPGPWRDVRAALRRVAPEQADDVLRGARETFVAFADHLSGPVPAPDGAR